ncbi:MAG: diguanylate cyclase [Thiobacillaceae bacterium]
MRRTFLIVTSAAFFILMILIIVLAVNSIVQLNNNRHLNTIVLTHNRKVNLITQIQVGSHQRTDSLLRMALTQDPFERDAIYMEYNRAAFLVGSGRNELKKMGLSPAEQIEFDRQTQLVTQIQATQEAVSDLLNADRLTDANTLLKQKAIPLQTAFNQQLAHMRNRYQDETLHAQTFANQTFDRTWRTAIGMGVTAALMSVIVGGLTLRRLSRRSRQFERQFAELEASRAALKQEASHDSLTGLANRRLFYDRLQQAIRHARRYNGKVGLLFIDLDKFKEVNDTHGHHVGDAVLTEVARRLTRSVRDSDSIARLGGDEFVVLLDNVRGRDDCLAAAVNIERTLAEDSSFYGLAVDISASIGQALFPDDGADEDALIRAADAAMYRIKGGAGTDRQRRFAFGQ